MKDQSTLRGLQESKSDPLHFMAAYFPNIVKVETTSDKLPHNNAYDWIKEHGKQLIYNRHQFVGFDDFPTQSLISAMTFERL